MKMTSLTVLAVALVATPVLAANGNSTYDRSANTDATRSMRYEMSQALNDLNVNIDMNPTVNTKEELDQWLENSKQALDEAKRQAKSEYEQQKEQQVADAEREYKNRARQIDDIKKQLDLKHDQLEGQLERQRQSTR